MESVYNTHRKFEGRFQGKKCALYTGKYGNNLSPTQNTPALQASMNVPTSGCRIWRFWMSAWQPTSQLFGIAVYTLRVTFCLSFVVCLFFTAIVMTWFASGPLMLICINKLNIPFSESPKVLSLFFSQYTLFSCLRMLLISGPFISHLSWKALFLYREMGCVQKW